MTSILIIPGYQNSGEGHWQSLWEGSVPGARRVEMPSWAFPVRGEWVETLDAAIADCLTPPILVGHSLGCIAIILWAAAHDRPIRGALLATPADVDRPDGLDVLRPFGPIPRQALGFPAILAASSADPFMDEERVRGFAVDWGARFVALGPCGHLNRASGHGPCPVVRPCSRSCARAQPVGRWCFRWRSGPHQYRRRGR